MSSSMARGFSHIQSVASTSWVINHGLIDGSKCAVEVFIDVAGVLEKAIPKTVASTADTITVTFSVAQKGEAYVI